MLTQEEVTFTCKQCHARAPVSDMKYNATGDYLICHDCYTKEHFGGEKELPSLARERRTFSQIQANLGRVSYKCTSCDYTFTRRADSFFSGTCPNCSKKSAKPTDSTAAERINKKKEPGAFFDVDDLLL